MTFIKMLSKAGEYLIIHDGSRLKAKSPCGPLAVSPRFPHDCFSETFWVSLFLNLLYLIHLELYCRVVCLCELAYRLMLDCYVILRHYCTFTYWDIRWAFNYHQGLKKSWLNKVVLVPINIIVSEYTYDLSIQISYFCKI